MSLEQPDYGVVAPISIPSGSKIPDPATGVASAAEYDRYFRLMRESPSLLDWSRTCLAVQDRLLADLAHTELSADERCEMLHGFIVILQVTLEKWVTLGDRVHQNDRHGESHDDAHAT